MDAHGRSGIGPAWRAGVRGRVDIDSLRMRGLGRMKRMAWLMLPVASSSALKSSGAMGKPAASALVQPSPRPEGG